MRRWKRPRIGAAWRRRPWAAASGDCWGPASPSEAVLAVTPVAAVTTVGRGGASTTEACGSALSTGNANRWIDSSLAWQRRFCVASLALSETMTSWSPAHDTPSTLQYVMRPASSRGNLWMTPTSMISRVDGEILPSHSADDACETTAMRSPETLKLA